MSLRRNIVANYISQAYVAGISIVTVPLYLKFMGGEAYGLIGFYTMLQAWFQLLDAGLSTTLARESSRYNAGATDASTLSQLRRVLEWAFVAVGVLGATFFFIFGEAIANKWLNVNALSLIEVTRCIELMGLVIAFRWLSCLYRGVVTGYEEQVWLGYFNIIIATARFPCGIPILILVDPSPVTYFSYQVVISFFETIILYWKANQLLPRCVVLFRGAIDRLGEPLKFASGVAFTSVAWVLVTQIDKLFLSSILALSDYGEFSLAIILAGGINLLAAPIGAAFLPRLTSTAANFDETGTRNLYLRYTELTCFAMFPIAFTVFACASQVLFAWTGNKGLSQSADMVLGIYSLGNAVMGLSSFAYYIQYAKGNVRLHLIGSFILAAIYLPAVVWAANFDGANGAAAMWLLMNMLYLLFWVPLVHRRLLPGLHMQWISKRVLPVVIGAAIPTLVVILIPSLMPENASRFACALFVLLFLTLSMLGSVLGSSILRDRIGLLIRRNAAC